MRRAAILSFTDRGAQTAARIAAALAPDWEVRLLSPKGGERPSVQALFPSVDALIFVGACGIAVRAIAPFVRDKTTDPAVVVVDERGIHAISLLSGHIGGANELTRRIAAGIGASPVITTATDVNHRFAADEWAARHNLAIASMQAAKAFAAEILRRDLPVHCDFPVEGALPGGLYKGAQGDCGLAVSCRSISPFDRTLLLVPRILHLGVGCKRNTPAQKIRLAVERARSAAELSPLAVSSLSSIDVKRDEPGLLAYCAEQNLTPRFFAAAQLLQVPGEFSASAFVRDTVGVDNVCERAAMCAAGEGAQLILKKTCLDGVTVAAAQEKWSACFE